MRGDPGPGGPQGVAQSDGPPVHVQQLRVDVEGLLTRQRLWRESLVDLRTNRGLKNTAKPTGD